MPKSAVHLQFLHNHLRPPDVSILYNKTAIFTLQNSEGYLVVVLPSLLQGSSEEAERP